MTELTKQELDYLQQQHIAVLTPVHYSCQVNYVQSILQLVTLCNKLQIVLEVILCTGDSLITRARNKTTQLALDTPATHLCWIDSDIGFDAVQVLQMIATGEPLVGAPYAKKGTNWQRYHNWLQEKFQRNTVPNPEHLQLATANQWVFNTLPSTVIGQLTPVDELGTGLLCTHREIYVALQPTIGSYTTDDEVPTLNYNYWQTATINNRLVSEDYYFCHLAKQHGYQPKIYLASTTHCGNYNWQTATTWI